MRHVFLLLFLTACAPYAPVFAPIDVEVPIPVPCKRAAIVKPDFALAHVREADDLAQKAKAALIELNQRRAYEAEMEGQIAACQ